jgi:uncharacterized membrane protein YgcG
MNRTIIAIVTFVALVGCYHDAHAFWGGDTRQSASGLDVSAGYDVNTVTTLRGTVITPPAKSPQSEHAEMTLATPQGAVTVLLGPWSYWSQQGITIARDQELSITGSRALGKDGTQYLFAQRLDKADGTMISLRTEAGAPMWSRNGSGSGSMQRGGRAGAGNGYRGGMMGGGGRR